MKNLALSNCVVLILALNWGQIGVAPVKLKGHMA